MPEPEWRWRLLLATICELIDDVFKDTYKTVLRGQNQALFKFFVSILVRRSRFNEINLLQ